MAIAGSTVGLADFTVRRPVDLALDLGTGAGIHALLAARHAGQVVAVDTSERALRFAAFNLVLNECTNVDLRRGDMFAPVAGMAFDLIVSNPPFVIGPRNAYEFRDAGRRSDTFCETLVRDVPRFLREGGLCQLLLNWAHVRGERWQERLGAWVEGSGCDAWVLRIDSKAPADYVDMYIVDEENAAGVRDDWVAALDEEAIESVSVGLMFLRRRTGGRNWFRVDDSPARLVPPIGEHVLRTFAGRDYSAVTSDEQLLAAMLSVGPDVHFQAATEARDGAFAPLVATLRLAGGLGYTADLEGALASVVLQLDGTQPLARVLESVAREAGMALEDVTDAATAAVRTLVERGFLVSPTL